MAAVTLCENALYVYITYNPQLSKGSDGTIFQKNLPSCEFGEGYPKLN